jgi:large subunit ribosomal protein L22
MVVSVATADEGPQMKRYMPRAMGRAYMIRKQTCHIALEIRTLED